jgi:hypothetical protein
MKYVVSGLLTTVALAKVVSRTSQIYSQEDPEA